jgi:hypothetical protein
VVWGGFGLGGLDPDRGIHAAVDALPWLAEHPQLIIGTTLASPACGSSARSGTAASTSAAARSASC